MARLGIFTVKVFYQNGGEFYTNGGYGLYLEQMCQSFDSVVMLCKLRKGVPPAGFYRVDHQNLEIVTVPALPSELGAIVVQPLVFFKGLSMMKKCDVVHARMPDWNGITGACVSRLSGVPCFHQIIDDWYGNAMSIPLKKSFGLGAGLRIALLIYDWLERLVSRGQLVFAQGQLSYDKHANACERHLVLSSAHRDEEISTVRDKCVGEQVKLLAVGRLQDVKNHEMLIRAMPEIRAFDPRCELTILGEGKKRDQLQSLAEQLGLSDVVSMPGNLPHDKLWSEYDAADLFILPSRSEGTPKVVLEAMARGCPVIASSVGGVPSAVKHMQSGLLFESNQQDQMTEMIQLMLKDELLRRHCQIKALEFSKFHTLEASTRFMLDRVTDRWPHLSPLRGSNVL